MTRYRPPAPVAEPRFAPERETTETYLNWRAHLKRESVYCNRSFATSISSMRSRCRSRILHRKAIRLFSFDQVRRLSSWTSLVTGREKPMVISAQLMPVLLQPTLAKEASSERACSDHAFFRFQVPYVENRIATKRRLGTSIRAGRGFGRASVRRRTHG